MLDNKGTCDGFLSRAEKGNTSSFIFIVINKCSLHQRSHSLEATKTGYASFKKLQSMGSTLRSFDFKF